MIIGVDLDNTIIDYGDLFYQEAINRNLLDSSCPKDKQSVRNALRALGREDDFTIMQGEVYGPGIMKASPFSGARETLEQFAAKGHKIKIISHKTRFPYLGEKHDLHACAKAWLEAKGFTHIPGIQIFLELSLKDKLARAQTEKCDIFIDDLPEFLMHPDFPSHVRRILFNPESAPASGETGKEGIIICSSWPEIASIGII